MTASVLYPAFALALAVAVEHLLSRKFSDLPFTAVVFVLGAVMGAASAGGHRSNLMAESIRIWVDVDPDLLLAVFLPPLLFESSMKLNLYELKKRRAEIVALAGPVVVVSTFVTAVFIESAIPRLSLSSFKLALVLGAVLTPTDPIAVSALLDEVASSPDLKTVLEGEGLFNDASAIVLYTVFLQSYLFETSNGKAGEAPAPANVFRSLCVQVLISPCVGIFFGIILLLWVFFLNRRTSVTDSVMQMSLTVSAAFLSYFVSDEVFSSSGVLAVVSCGLFIGAFVLSIVHSREFLLSVWRTATFAANAILFILGGTMFGFAVADGAERSADLKPADYGYVVLLFVFLVSVRFACVFLVGLYLEAQRRLFERFSHDKSRRERPFGYREYAFVSWGGLKGALSIALALALDNETRGDEEGSRIVFYVSGVSLLSQVVQATTAGFFLQKSGLSKWGPANMRVLELVRRRMVLEGRRAYDELSRDEIFRFASKVRVSKMCDAIEETDLHPTSMHQMLRQSSIKESRAWKNAHGDTSGKGRKYYLKSERRLNHLREYNMEGELRLVFLEGLRTAYHSMIADALIPEESFVAYALLGSVDAAKHELTHEQGGNKLKDLDFALERQTKSVEFYVSAIFDYFLLKKKFDLTSPTDLIRKEREYVKVFMALCVIRAHAHVCEELGVFFSTSTASDDVSARQLVEAVLEESKEETDRAKAILKNAPKSLLKRLSTNVVCRVVVARQEDFVTKAANEGVIPSADADLLLKDLERQTAAVRAAASALEDDEESPLVYGDDDEVGSAFSIRRPLSLVFGIPHSALHDATLREIRRDDVALE